MAGLNVRLLGVRRWHAAWCLRLFVYSARQVLEVSMIPAGLGGLCGFGCLGGICGLDGLQKLGGFGGLFAFSLSTWTEPRKAGFNT